MAQQELDNNVALSEQRAKINNNALDAVSKSDTTDQALASNVDFAAGKGPLYDGVSYLPLSGEYTATLTPETSGTVTIDPTQDVMSYHKVGPLVTVFGGLTISSVSAPVGNYIAISIPYSIASGSELSGWIGGSCTYSTGATYSVLPLLGISSQTVIRIYMDASLFVGTDFLSFSISYLTGV